MNASQDMSEIKTVFISQKDRWDLGKYYVDNYIRATGMPPQPTGEIVIDGIRYVMDESGKVETKGIDVILGIGR